MSKQSNNLCICISSDLNFLLLKARNYKRDALKIKNGDYGGCSDGFHMLTTISLELFLKTLVAINAVKKFNDPNISSAIFIDTISKSISKYGHNIDLLFRDLQELSTVLEINKVSVEKHLFAREYVIEFKVGLAIIKDLEGLRYGSFAKHQDKSTVCFLDKNIVYLLDVLEEYIMTQFKLLLTDKHRLS